ncbi:TolC family protein [Persephonella sp. KM09-Lau-8]|uniref:TolC family protein n=1 Tax=Persephonella sp. KM09-Lau-8 TaxID=1158345 RepID=UPI000496FE97|nr:TolC family protein [Persephonella sp. KM09-Lau-8]
MKYKALLLILIINYFSYGTTLTEIIQTAKENSPILKQKKIEIKIKRFEKNMVNSKRFGEINLFGTFHRYEDKRILYPISPPINSRTIVGARNQFVAGISYNIPLFTGFELERKIDILDLSEKIKKIDYKLTEQQLIFNIKSIYYKILSLQKQKKALEAYKKSMEKLYENINEAYKVGRKPETDLLKVQYGLEEIKANLEKVENSINSLKSALIALVGKDIDLSNFEDIQSPSQIPQLKEVEQLKKIQKINLAYDISDKKLDVAKSLYLPKVYLNAQLQRNMGNDEYKDLWFLGLTIKYDLFDFGYRKNQYIKAKLEKEKVLYQKKAVILKLKSEIQKALDDIKSATAKLNASKKQLEYAKQVEESEKAKYEEGVSDLYDYLYAKAQKFMAESQYYQAFYNRETAIAYLKYLLEEIEDEK